MIKAVDDYGVRYEIYPTCDKRGFEINIMNKDGNELQYFISYSIFDKMAVYLGYKKSDGNNER